jgi:hypothetical protein
MTTEEKIKASIRKKLEAERGRPLGFARVQTRASGLLHLTPPPILVVVEDDGAISSIERPERKMPEGLEFRDPPSDDERRQLDEQWDAALVKASALRRGDVAIVAHAQGARVELRKGPNFDPPGEGE